MSDEKPVTVVRVDDVLNGRYHLKQKIGEGGMGSVYLAHDRELDREVAVKLLAMALVNDDEVVERFEREAKMTARLDHPNIVPVYDVGRHQGRPFIVMKQLEGQTLAGVLREKGGFTADETLTLMRQIAAGLDHIHQRGFIHRDIKAGNIFVSPSHHATILDFGILRSSHANESKTKTGVVMGTPHYMAPEQAMGARDVDHRVDLYALAVVLFECLTGTLPFEADSELRLIQMQAHTPPPDLIERAPWIPKPVADVVRRALAKRPDDRFASATELVRALEVAYRESKMTSVPSPPPSAPSSYQGPKDAPGTAPSWRRRGEDDAQGAPLPPPPGVFIPGTSPSLRAVAAQEIANVPDVVTPDVTLSPGAAGVEGRPVEPAPRRSLTPYLAVAMLVAVAGVLAVIRPWQTTPIIEKPVVIATADAGVEAEPDAGVDEALLALLDAGDVETVDAGEALAVQLAPDAGRSAVKPARPGNLSVLTSREGEPFWAQVFINGAEKGRSPLQLELQPGKYEVRVERTGFKPEHREIRVNAGKSTVVRIDLAP